MDFLGGSCCIPNCKNSCPKCPIHEQCIPGCKSRIQGCKKEEKGFFVELRYLQLHGNKVNFCFLKKINLLNI